MEEKNELKEQEEYLIEWPEVISEIINSSNMNDRVKQFLDFKLKQSENQIQAQKHYTSWASITQFILSLLVVIGVFVLTYLDKLQGQTAATLIGAMVGYLFGRFRK